MRTGRAVVRLVLRPLLALIVLGVLAGFGLALRLAAAPLDVTWLAHVMTPLPLGGRTGEKDARGRSSSWGRLEIGQAWVSWEGFRRGLGAPVTLRLQDVSIRQRDGVAVDHIDRLAVSLRAPDLLVGELQVVEVAVAGVRLNLRRDPEDGLGLGLAPVGQAPPQGSSGPVARWTALRRVAVSDMQVSVHDLVVGQNWTLRRIGIDMRPAARGVIGQFGASMLIDGRQADVRGNGVASPDGSDVTWRINIDPLVPARLASALPMLAPLRALDLPVSMGLDVDFANGPGQFMEPVQATLAARLGVGTLDAGGSPLSVDSGLVRIEASLPDGPKEMVTLRLLQGDLKLRAREDRPDAAPTGPELHAHGRLALDSFTDARHISATLDADIPSLDFATVARYWPVQAAPGARHWITANVTAGQVTGLHVETHLSGDDGWNSVVETGRSGGFDASGMTLWWLRPILPLVDMRAHLDFDGPDAVMITVPRATLPVGSAGPVGSTATTGPSATTGPGGTTEPDAAIEPGGATALLRSARTLAVSDSSMRITGLEAKHQLATIQVRMDGDLGDLLNELSQPRLRLLSRHPVPFTHPAGGTDNRVTVVLPLESSVSVDEVRVQARSTMTGVHLGNVAAGRSLDKGQLSVAADADGLSLDGTGMVGDVAAQMHYAMDFRAGPPEQLTEQAHVHGVVTPLTLRQEGLDPSDNVSGSAGLTVDYAARRDGKSTVSLGLDMTGLGISTQVWSKQAGIAANASARIALTLGHLTAIDQLHASGPGLMVDARAEIAGGQARRLVVGSFTVGRTSGEGRIELPIPVAPGQAAHPILVTARGPVLDLAPAFGAAGKKSPVAAKSDGAQHAAVPWIADVSFGRVYVGPDAAFGQVVAHIEDDGRRIVLARLDAAGPTPVMVRLSPDRSGRRLAGSVADTGQMLRTLGVTGAISGGALRLDGRFDDRAPGSPLAGTVSVGRFVIPDAPTAARIVRNLSVYGWLGALPAPQLAVDRLVAPFSYRNSVLTLSDARAHSTSLGVTMRGEIDLARRHLDLKGTVVPAWVINQLPGQIPLVGRLLSPEKDGGVLAATAAIRGPFSNPDVHVNALATLAPGLLRRLLFE